MIAKKNVTFINTADGYASLCAIHYEVSTHTYMRNTMWAELWSDLFKFVAEIKIHILFHGLFRLHTYYTLHIS